VVLRFSIPRVKQTLKGKEYCDLETAEHWFGGSSQNSKVLSDALGTHIF
jgi:hypothetical protein